MRTPLLLFALSLFATTAFGQSSTCIGSEAIIVDTVVTELHLSGSYGSRPSEFIAATSETTLIWEYIATRPPTGGIDLHIPVDSIHVTGDGADADSLSTVDLFDLIAQTSMANSLSLGHFSCSDSCPGATVHVYQKACVHRTGMGTSMHFTPCSGSSCCAREYRVCCPTPNGSPLFSLVSGQSVTCSSTTSNDVGCETTCP